MDLSQRLDEMELLQSISHLSEKETGANEVNYCCLIILMPEKELEVRERRVSEK